MVAKLGEGTGEISGALGKVYWPLLKLVSANIWQGSGKVYWVLH
jgi:hypothetical protein